LGKLGDLNIQDLEAEIIKARERIIDLENRLGEVLEDLRKIYSFQEMLRKRIEDKHGGHSGK
jgi:predicted  nucleic acid-binding Zn-ribbon protein